MRTTIMTVTPELAQQWLDESNLHNRPLREAAVRALAKQIERGEWQLSHQGIAFDEKGILLDGQHRLAAIARAGRQVEIMVTFDAPRSSFSVLDTGQKRTGRDVLALANEDNPLYLASALRGLYLYQNFPENSWSGQTSMISNDQLLDLLEEHPGMREAVVRGIAIGREIAMTPTAAAIGWYVTTTARPDVNQHEWYVGLTTGANLPIGDPRLALIKTMRLLASGKTTRRRDDSRIHLFYYLKAWNAWVEGRSIKQLRMSPREKAPRPTTRPAIF
ncbi:hypothetical protein AC529_01935 [Thermobifida cellulosilytica TB100]|uniref:ParB/Sulfiredoxin domain-containing protein n=2 Tax=Thermobifida cellulosilytica TaxID=144786 RepID=A0A147KMB2_THECS|nr:hypothetical protein AC529_01935 [Thermobifida cellulosilytica TB100]